MKPTVTIDDFAKLDLRVGTVLTAERKEGSEKLIRLTVDFGEEGKRNILTGIAQWYQPEELLNKQYIFVFNLLPRTMMGEESQGMILAANGKNKPLLLKPSKKTQSGATIR
ncbi:MAG TPA: methionine--tRNA ligase subunit beta [Patescibacteria group bacterium]|nr:methionine--tRNA ligase subunit beta [Patescibacteria group bacterium]